MARHDIVRWFIEAVSARGESCLTPDGLLNLELDARAEWGGQRIEYIAKTMTGRRPTKLPPAEEQQVYRRAIDTDIPSDRLADESGISRSTLYRLLKRGPRK